MVRPALAKGRSVLFCKEKNNNLAKKKTIKRKTIINAKRRAWAKIITDLNPKKGQKELWAFTKAMAGRSYNFSVAGQDLQSRSSSVITDSKEMAVLLINIILEERNKHKIIKNKITFQ